MKKNFLLVVSLLCGLFSCRHDDMWDSIDDLKTRVTVLEGVCKTANTNINSLQTIVQTSENHDYVTGVNEITKDGEVTGYIITFAKSKAITLYVGSEEAYVPAFTVEKGTDGNYYWMLDGQYVCDQDGNKVCANGKDGQDGSDGSDGSSGSDGKDGITPTLKIEKGVLYASYDTGKTWKELGKVAGADGQSGSDGADGITPQLKVEKGLLYVSYDKGETWINQGNVTGSNGSDGQDGVDGKDGVTPRLKIEDDYWYVSYDQEKTWTKLSKATGEKGESLFTGLKQDANSVTLMLSDGTELVLLKGTVTNAGVNGSDFIHFDDINVKQICLQNWDTNHDNELSYDEAAAVEDITGVFRAKSISMFNELQFFTGLKSIGDECFRMTGISYVKLPPSIEHIGTLAFSATKISNIFIPRNVKEIGTSAFSSCSNLSHVVFESGSMCKVIGEKFNKGAFQSCNNLESITIPSSVDSIGVKCFAECKSLREVTFEENSTLRVLSDSVFFQCYEIEELAFPSSVEVIGTGLITTLNPGYLHLKKISFGEKSQLRTIGSSAFYNCSELAEIDLSQCDLLENLGYGCFRNTNWKDVKIASTKSKINCFHVADRVPFENRRMELLGDFESLSLSVSSTRTESFAFYVHSKRPSPSFKLIDADRAKYTIYVPRDYVEDYKSAWSEYADHIAPYDYE